MTLRPDTAPHAGARDETSSALPDGFVLPPHALARLQTCVAQRPGQRIIIGLVGAPGAGKSTVAQGLRAALHAMTASTVAPIDTRSTPAPDTSTTALAIVPMDGFHLANRELQRLGRAARKGAPDTFDAAGYVALLHRLRHQPITTASAALDATALATAGFESTLLDVRAIQVEGETAYTNDTPTRASSSQAAFPSNDDVIYAPAFHREIEEPIAGEIPVGADVTLIITEGNYLLLDAPHWRDVRPLLDDIWFIDVSAEQRHAQLLARHMAHGRSREDALSWIAHTDEPNARVILESVRAAGEQVFHLRIDS